MEQKNMNNIQPVEKQLLVVGPAGKHGRGRTNANGTKKRIALLENDVTDIKNLLGMDGAASANIQYLIGNIRQLRTIIENDGAKLKRIGDSARVMEDYLRNNDLWALFIAWVNERHKDHFDISGCGQCGKNHAALKCFPLKAPNGNFTHSSLCPMTKKPIFVTVGGWKPDDAPPVSKEDHIETLKKTLDKDIDDELKDGETDE